MPRFLFTPLLCLPFVLGCGDETSAVANPSTYSLIVPGTPVMVRQDSTISLKDFGLVVTRIEEDRVDTIPGANSTTQPLPRLSYFIDDRSIAITDQFGVVRGLKGGTTTFRAIGYGEEISFPVTVVPWVSTEVILRVLSGPAGGLIPVASRRDTGTFYALPTDRLSSRLEGLVLRGTDTLFCSYCGTKSPARIQRLVTFRSLRPEIAEVSNAANPFAQRTSQTGTEVNTDTTGRVTVFDTSSTPVGFVLEVPGDNVSDTAWVKFALRPIDTLRIDADSAEFPPSDIDEIGTERRKYPNSDTTAGNVTQSGDVNLVVRADYIFAVRRLLRAPTTNSDTVVRLPIRRSGSETVRRENLPIIVWESALSAYLDVNSTDVNLGAVIGRCAFIGDGCAAPTRSDPPGPVTAAQRTQIMRDSLVINCLDNGPKLPGVLQNGLPAGEAIRFGGDGLYSIPGCNPAKTIPMPGAFCSSATATDLFSTCTVWLKATTVDPATNKVLVDRYRVNIRR